MNAENLFRYYYTTDPNDFEIQELMEMAPLSFIGIPKDSQNLGNTFNAMNNSPNYACFFGVDSEAELQIIVRAWLEKRLTKATWQGIGAKRLFFKAQNISEDEDGNYTAYDWTTFTKVQVAIT